MKRLLAFVVLVCMASVAFPAEEHVDLDMVTQIRQEEFKNSQVMETASELMDRIGPRLTGSPQMKNANEWTKTKLAEWGVSNAHLETWGPFGRGWQYEACAVRMVAPDHAELLALPQAWTPGTNGPVRASVLRLNVKSKDELEKLKGKYTGKIVLYGDVREVKPHDKPDLSRYDDKALAEIATYELPGGPPRYDRAEFMKRAELRRAAEAFLLEEKPLAVIDLGRGDFGTFNVQGGGEYKKSKPMATTPWLSMESEHFGRIARLLDRDVPVELELDVKATFVDEDQMQWNTIAEIPGTDKKDEVVMVGAHLDSWHAGTGATDNGAGSVVAMEVMRILKALNVKPRRTIRIGLWTGEEQGLYGSRAYVDQHFASRPPMTAEEKEKPWYLQKEKWPLTVKPEHAKLAAYFNLDNGTGKIRGIYAENNAAVVPDLRGVAAALPRPRRDDGHDEHDRRHGPRVVRRGGPARVPVHPGRDRVRHAHAPHEHGPLRAAGEEGPRAGGGGHGELRLQRRHARRHAAAQAHAEGARQGRKDGRAEAGRPAGKRAGGDAAPLRPAPAVRRPVRICESIRGC